MKTTYIYYPGFVIAIILLILNVNLVWVVVSLLVCWIGITENYKLDKPAIIVWFPLLRNLLKKIKI